MMNRRQL